MNDPIFGAGASVPVSKQSMENALTAATIAGVAYWTYSDQQRDLDKYDKALGIDVNLPKDVRKRMRDEAFRSKGEKPPVSPARAVVNLWIVTLVALFAIYAIAALILEVI